MKNTHTSRRRLAVGAIAAGLLLAACGGGDDDANSATPVVVAADGAAPDDGDAPADDATADEAAASDEVLALEFAACMRDEGIDWPDPTTGADGSIDLFGGEAPASIATDASDAVIEAARNLAGLEGAMSTEFDPQTPHPVVGLITEWQDASGSTEERSEASDMGGTMRLGVYTCHLTPGTKAAAAYRQAGREMGSDPPFRFVTASLHVDYLRPTPLGVPLEIRGRVEEIKGKKVVVSETLSANGEVCAKGRVVAVRMPADMLKGKDR